MADEKKDDKQVQISLDTLNKKANLAKADDDDLEQRTNAALGRPQPGEAEEDEEEEDEEQTQEADEEPKKKDDKEPKSSSDPSDSLAADLADTINKLDPEKALDKRAGRAFTELFGEKEETTMSKTPDDPGTKITNDPAGAPKPKPGVGKDLDNVAEQEQGNKRKLSR